VLKVRVEDSDDLSLEGLDKGMLDIKVKPSKVQVRNCVVQGYIFIVNGKGV
jgi:hypothetical protein